VNGDCHWIVITLHTLTLFCAFVLNVIKFAWYVQYFACMVSDELGSSYSSATSLVAPTQ
jgi:hypothetical protein